MRKSTHKRIKFFSKRPLKSSFDHFLDFLDSPEPPRLFFITQALLFLFYDFLTLCKKSERADQPLLRSCIAKRRMDQRAGKQGQIHRIFALTQVFKNVSQP